MTDVFAERIAQLLEENYHLHQKINRLMKDNEQLKSEKQAIIDILDEMENGDCFWDRDYLIECISDIETVIGVDFE